VTDRLPRAVRASQRPLVVPPYAPLGNRVTIGPDALRAAYGAHIGAEHEGRRGYGCRTCRRYIEAVIAARATARAAADPGPSS
jgi:hypothetical protein